MSMQMITIMVLTKLTEMRRSVDVLKITLNTWIRTTMVRLKTMMYHGLEMLIRKTLTGIMHLREI